MDNIILIIALIGDNRCGKDTFADIIKSNGNFKQYAFMKISAFSPLFIILNQ